MLTWAFQFEQSSKLQTFLQQRKQNQDSCREQLLKVPDVLEYVRTPKPCIISFVHTQTMSSFQKEKTMISQQQRFIYIPFIGIFILSLFVGLFLATRKRSSKTTASKKVAKHKAETAPDEALKYWTTEKMSDAKAAPLPEVNNLKRGKEEPRPSPRQDT